jgi:hypothetical protein
MTNLVTIPYKWTASSCARGRRTGVNTSHVDSEYDTCQSGGERIGDMKC